MFALCLISFLSGATIGSFLNVCIYRLPEDKSIVKPGSHCRACGSPIAWYDNIPILSALILRFRCRKCGKGYSPRYLLVEFLTAAIFTAVTALFIKRPDALACIPFYWIFCALLITVSFIDLDHYIIPDECSLGGAIAGMAFCAVFPSLMGELSHWKGFCWSAFGFLLGGSVLYSIAVLGSIMLREEAMGMGDVKLLAMIGAFTGWKGALFSLVFSSFFGSVFGVSIILLRKQGLKYKIPYGPYIALAALVSLFFGDAIVSWYSDLFWNPSLP